MWRNFRFLYRFFALFRGKNWSRNCECGEIITNMSVVHPLQLYHANDNLREAPIKLA